MKFIILAIAVLLCAVYAQNGGTGTGSYYGSGTGSYQQQVSPDTRLQCIFQCIYRIDWNRISGAFSQCLFQPQCLQDHLKQVVEEKRGCLSNCLQDQIRYGSGSEDFNRQQVGSGTGTGSWQQGQQTGQPVGSGTGPAAGTGNQAVGSANMGNTRINQPNTPAGS